MVFSTRYLIMLVLSVVLLYYLMRETMVKTSCTAPSHARVESGPKLIESLLCILSLPESLPDESLGEWDTHHD